MRNATVIAAVDFVTMRWRNGTGSTTELIKRDSPDGDGFGWRISMATVAEDGQFSNFSGYDRTLVLLEGEGLTLSHTDKKHDGGKKAKQDILNNPLQIARFDGGSTTVAALHSGSIKDFNIMTRSGIYRAQTTCGDVANPIKIATSADALLAYSVAGELTVADHREKTLGLAAGALLVVEPPTEKGYSFKGSAFIVVEIFNKQLEN